MERTLTLLEIMSLRLFNRPLNAYNTKIRLREQEWLKNTIVFRIITTQEQNYNWKCFRKQIGNIVSTLELTKERFLIIKKRAQFIKSYGCLVFRTLKNSKIQRSNQKLWPRNQANAPSTVFKISQPF